MSLNGETPAPPPPGPQPLLTRIGSCTIEDRGWVVLEVASLQGLSVFFLDPEVVPGMARDMLDAAERAEAGAAGAGRLPGVDVVDQLEPLQDIEDGP